MIKLKADISVRYKPFLDTVLEHHQDLIHSVHIVGSALTQDFDPKISDINSVVVLDKMDLKFLEFLAPLGIHPAGFRYGDRRRSRGNSGDTIRSRC